MAVNHKYLKTTDMQYVKVNKTCGILYKNWFNKILPIAVYQDQKTSSHDKTVVLYDVNKVTDVEIKLIFGKTTEYVISLGGKSFGDALLNQLQPNLIKNAH